MKLSDVVNGGSNRTICVYSGRFQPFHAGHNEVYKGLVERFGKRNVFVVTSNKTNADDSPLNFDEKLEVAKAMFGIPAEYFVQVKEPYRPKELFSFLDKDQTTVVFALGEKDAERFDTPFFKPYNQELSKEPYSKCAYVYLNPMMKSGLSATMIRDKFKSGASFQDFVNVYGKFDQGVFDLMTNKFGLPTN